MFDECEVVSKLFLADLKLRLNVFNEELLEEEKMVDDSKLSQDDFGL